MFLLFGFLNPFNSGLLFSSTPDSSKALSVEFRNSYGFIIQHHLDMGLYTNHHFPCYEADLGFRVSGKKDWHSQYSFPTMGLGYWYSSLGNTSILGDVHGLLFWSSFPLYVGKYSSINLRLGGGLGYFKKKFDRYENYKNLAIGSHINANLQFGLEYRVRLYKFLAIGVTAGVAHFSNGTMFTPNYGINVPHAGFMVNWNKNDINNRDPKAEKFHFSRFWETKISVSNGIKEILPVMGRKFLVFSGSMDWIYHRSPVGGIGIGLDLFWDESEREILNRLDKPEVSNAGLIKPGIKVIKSWDIGKVDFNIEAGVYLYEKERSDGSVYDKLVLNYSVTELMFTTLYLKTHFARADYIGWGVGVKIRKKGEGRGQK
ncbi:MAG: acyloxyacyl hydrolase [Bacteroidales bacterium]